MISLTWLFLLVAMLELLSRYPDLVCGSLYGEMLMFGLLSILSCYFKRSFLVLGDTLGRG